MMKPEEWKLRMTRAGVNGGATGPVRIGFLLLDNFTLIAHSAAIEPLHMANQLSGQEHYQWLTLSEAGEPVRASDGQRMLVDAAIDDALDLDIVIVCGGVAPQQTHGKSHLRFLQALARRGCMIGGVATGTWALAQGGLLDGYRASIHWELIPGLQEAFPRVIVTNRLFTIEAKRLTASGGTAALDMMLNLIGQQHGAELMTAISERVACDRVRTEEEQQRVPLRHVLGTSQPKLLEVVALMEANVEEPLELEELADAVNVSRRQVERLFVKHLACSPSRYYQNVRLNRGRQLLQQTSMTVIEVASACGFASAPHFSRRYNELFGLPPSNERTCEPVRRAGRGRRKVFMSDELSTFRTAIVAVSQEALALLAARSEASYAGAGRGLSSVGAH